MAQLTKKVRVASNGRRSSKTNPRRKSKRPAHSSRPTNAAPRKGNTMAKKTTKAANGKKTRSAAHRKSTNPHKGRRRQRNPEWLGSPKDLLTAGVAGLANAVLTRQLPQMVLSGDNSGVKGYGANLVTALGGAWLAGKFAGPAAGKAALVGGMVILLDRVLTEQVSPIGPYLTLSGVGDATAMRGMGTVRDGWYSHPSLIDANGNLMAPAPYTQQAVDAVVAQYPMIGQPAAVHAVNPSALRRHVASGQMISSRFQTRFNQSLN